MTEADALIRARALLKEPTARAPGAITALAVSAAMALLAVGAVGAVVLAPPDSLTMAAAD